MSLDSDSFGLRERLGTWFFNCFRCNSSENSFVGTLQDAEKRAPPKISQQLKKLLDGSIVKLKICETSRLQLDPNVMHPFVKVHIVNKNTGNYLPNLQKTEDPAIYHFQQLTIYNKTQKKFEATQNDILLPFATSMCDFRTLGNSKGIWNQKFFINYPANLLFHPDTLILFEILDFNHQALVYRNDEETFDRNNFYRVAWSFLRPVGLSRNHIGKSQLQLYRYKYENSSNQNMYGKSFIPQVYFDFLWNNHEKYQGSLTVQLNYSPRPKYRYVQQGNVPSNLFQDEHYDRKYLQKFKVDQFIPGQQVKPKTQQQLLKYYRNRDICEIPQQLIFKFESQLRGCYRLKFINNYLIACCSNKKNTSIKIFHLDKGQHKMTLKGHRGIIYKIDCTPDEKFLITAGSDSLVKIWKIPEDTGEYIDEDESEQLLIGQCTHSAAVYSISIIYQPLQDLIYILSCCYDGFIRLWECKTIQESCLNVKDQNINDYTRSHQRVFPTASAVAEGSYFIVGDNIGQIRIYDFSRDKLSLRCLIANQQLKGDGILSIHILNKSHLMIQAKDNVIRHFELLGNKLRIHQSFSGAVFENQFSNCSISPDNKYLLAPSQTGKPVLWDVLTGNTLSLDHLNLNMKGRLVCCDWHPKYNLIAISGFLQYCPIFVFGNILSEPQIKMVMAQIQ